MNLNDKKRVLSQLNIGDVVKCVDGKDYEFVSVKRTKFVGKHGTAAYSIPIEWFVDVVERKKQPTFDPNNIREGELFYIVDEKGRAIVYRFQYMMNHDRIFAKNPISGTDTRIDVALYAGKIDELRHRV